MNSVEKFEFIVEILAFLQSVCVYVCSSTCNIMRTKISVSLAQARPFLNKEDILTGPSKCCLWVKTRF